MIKGYFNKQDLKVYVDYYFRDNNLDVCRQIGYFDFKNNWQKVSTNTELESVFNNVTLENLNIDDLNHFTPPTPTGYGVVIPTEFQWVFPENKFVLKGFEIPLQNGAVDVAYFQWQEFRDELDNGNHDYLKRALMPLWDYVELQVANNNLIVL